MPINPTAKPPDAPQRAVASVKAVVYRNHEAIIMAGFACLFGALQLTTMSVLYAFACLISFVIGAAVMAAYRGR